MLGRFITFDERSFTMSLLKPARTALLSGLALTTSAAWSIDAEKFALLTMGITRAAAVEIVGTPNSEHCSTSFGLRICRLMCTPFALLAPKIIFRATFDADCLISSSTCQSAQCRASKE